MFNLLEQCMLLEPCTCLVFDYFCYVLVVEPCMLFSLLLEPCIGTIYWMHPYDAFQLSFLLTCVFVDHILSLFLNLCIVYWNY